MNSPLGEVPKKQRPISAAFDSDEMGSPVKIEKAIGIP
jgi:hypothetical protein